ncbi:MAG: hypothetical protein R3D27_02705 [Hyphomicrobiaceae bacterium]
MFKLTTLAAACAVTAFAALGTSQPGKAAAPAVAVGGKAALANGSAVSKVDSPYAYRPRRARGPGVVYRRRPVRSRVIYRSARPRVVYRTRVVYRDRPRIVYRSRPRVVYRSDRRPYLRPIVAAPVIAAPAYDPVVYDPPLYDLPPAYDTVGVYSSYNVTPLIAAPVIAGPTVYSSYRVAPAPGVYGSYGVVPAPGVYSSDGVAPAGPYAVPGGVYYTYGIGRGDPRRRGSSRRRVLFYSQ